MTKAIATTNLYPALTEEAVEGMCESVESNLDMGSDRIDPRKLFTTITFPGGGSTIWEIPAVEGDSISTKEFTGIIFHINTERARYQGKFGGDKRPLCTSQNGEIGHGDPGGECMSCAYNEFGSHEEYPGRKACTETKQLYFIMKDTGDFPTEKWPMICRIPAGSFPILEEYRIRLAKTRTKLYTVETKFTLTKQKNKQDIPFAQVLLTRGDTITDPEMIKAIESYKAGILPFIKPQSSEAKAAA